MDSRSSLVVSYSLVIIIVLLSAFSFQLSAFAAEEVSSGQLIEKAKELDGKTVTYTGELIASVMKRGEYSWVNLNDGANAIGVWCRTSHLASVKFAGNYDCSGDMIKVEGVFNRACPLHGGELDIHAFSVVVVKEGSVREEKIDKGRARFSVVVFSALIIMTMVFRNRL